jgi:hypothetical protein
VAAHLLVTMLAIWAQFSSSSAVLVMAVVVVVADAVSITGVVILLKHVGGGGVVCSFATILPGGNTPRGTACAHKQRLLLQVTARRSC